jgi:hypothetical protein
MILCYRFHGLLRGRDQLIARTGHSSPIQLPDPVLPLLSLPAPAYASAQPSGYAPAQPAGYAPAQPAGYVPAQQAGYGSALPVPAYAPANSYKAVFSSAPPAAYQSEVESFAEVSYN